jgi:signal transduction histidine kinase
LCVCFLFVFAFAGGSGPAAPRVAIGTLDLGHWDFARDNDVRLAGRWKFFDSRWARDIDGATPVPADVPALWPATNARGETRATGFATYAMTLLLPENIPGERLGIDTGYIYSAYRLYANGEIIASGGAPSASTATEVQGAYGKIAMLPSGVRTVELRLEISNHLRSFAGFLSAPRVGLYDAMVAEAQLHVTISILLVGAMLFAAAYHFVVFAIDRELTASLWFGMFAASLGARTVLISPLAPYALPFLGQDWLWRIDFAVTLMLLPTAYWYFAVNFPRQVSRRYTQPLMGVSLAAALASIVFGADAGGTAIKFCEFLSPVPLTYLTYGLARAAWQREAGANLALTGWVLSAAATVHDILIDNWVIAGINLMPFGFLAFFLCLSGTLVARYSDALRRSRSRNEDLEGAVSARTRELSDKIDELKRSQADLERARSEAVSANVAKSRFLAMMSHELRTPLNSILGFSDIIHAETLGPLGDARYGEYAKHISDSGHHLLNLVGDVLDISRIEAGKVELHFEPLDLTEICQVAMHHAATRERRAGDAVTMMFEAGLPAVNADRRAVTQMVVNLLSNALKFTPPDGRITLSGRRRADGGITIEVADTGAGMDPADIPKALALFSQVDDGLARRHDGTGLGLPIVKALIELHAGSLSVESGKGRGTVVRLDFPPRLTCGMPRQAPAYAAS